MPQQHITAFLYVLATMRSLEMRGCKSVSRCDRSLAIPILDYLQHTFYVRILNALLQPFENL